MRRPGFNLCVGKVPWRRKWQPTPVFLPGESRGQRGLVGTVHGAAKSRTRLSDFTWAKMKSSEWALIQYDSCPQEKKRKCGHRGAEWESYVKTQGEESYSEDRERPQRNRLCWHLALGLQLPELRGNKLLLFKLPHLWYLVISAGANEYTVFSAFWPTLNFCEPGWPHILYLSKGLLAELPPTPLQASGVGCAPTLSLTTLPLACFLSS